LQFNVESSYTMKVFSKILKIKSKELHFYLLQRSILFKISVRLV